MGTTLRVCLISPGHLVTNPRLVKEADALSESGYDVTVITGDYMDWAHEADARFLGRAWRIAHKVPFGPLGPKLKYLEQTVRRRIARVLTRFLPRSLTIAEYAQHPIAFDLVRAAISVKADLYIAHYVAALPAAARSARAHGAHFGFDAEDFHSGDYPVNSEYLLDKKLIQMIERKYLPDCKYVTAASPGIAEAYASAYNLRMPTVVLNVFPLSNAPRAPTALGTAVPGPSVYWFSQTIGPDRGLEIAVAAISISAARPHLYLRGTPAPGYKRALTELARRCGAAERLHFLNTGDPWEMERLASIYDVGFVGETGRTENHRIALANKLFTYLLAGLPVVASSIPAHHNFFDKTAPVFLYDHTSPTDLARVLDALLLDRHMLATARSAAWQLGQERYNWEIEKLSLCSAITEALSER